MKTPSLLLVFLLAALGATGCNKLRDAAIKQKKANDLKRLCEAYGEFYSARERGPGSVEDLEPLAKGDAELQGLLEAVGSGKYVLLWGVDVHAVGRTRPGMAFTVLGYESQVPRSGGMVLMVDGSVLEMTPKKFAAAQKGNALGQNGPA